ncbi:MAG TPA: M56 family metallopeptidase [Candidatus Dormibacteraeota bacterium]|nr:M56 family metallopeptidase [Candidatus Dormibacteraeota bacterium]
MVIVSAIARCPDPVACLQRYAHLDVWMQLLVTVVAPVAALLAAVWLARFAFLLSRADRVVRRLPTAEAAPARLAAAVARTGVRRVRCIASSDPIAFCAGAICPVIVVSEGLADRLDDDELDAVLLHEHHHLREREPAIRAAAEAAAEVLFFMPIARWWSRRRTEQAELRADRAALDELGAQPVAAALCALGQALSPEAAAFAGVAELRVAQLLGDPIPVRRPGFSMVATSLFGVAFTIVVGSCIIRPLTM